MMTFSTFPIDDMYAEGRQAFINGEAFEPRHIEAWCKGYLAAAAEYLHKLQEIGVLPPANNVHNRVDTVADRVEPYPDLEPK